jgi:hypothetical protein
MLFDGGAPAIQKGRELWLPHKFQGVETWVCREGIWRAQRLCRMQTTRGPLGHSQRGLAGYAAFRLALGLWRFAANRGPSISRQQCTRCGCPPRSAGTWPRSLHQIVPSATPTATDAPIHIAVDDEAHITNISLTPPSSSLLRPKGLLPKTAASTAASCARPLALPFP